jgi:hypothetical protein
MTTCKAKTRTEDHTMTMANENRVF